MSASPLPLRKLLLTIGLAIIVLGVGGPIVWQLGQMESEADIPRKFGWRWEVERMEQRNNRRLKDLVKWSLIFGGAGGVLVLAGSTLRKPDASPKG
jgi:hypothetical protein